MKKVRGSQSGFALGDLVFTKYSSGCLRSIMLADQGIRESIDNKHQERGALNEEVYENGLKELGTQYDREKTVSEPIGGFVDTYFVGRLDYLLHDAPANDRTVVELKSTESSTVLKDVIKDGKYNFGNLAQLVSYMVSERCLNGVLTYTYYKPKNKTKVYLKTAERSFKVDIDDQGRIQVDDQPTPFSIYDQLHHRQMSAVVINEKIVGPRPYQESTFNSPCKFCPFSRTCELYDLDMFADVDEFIDHAREELTNKPPKK